MMDDEEKAKTEVDDSQPSDLSEQLGNCQEALDAARQESGERLDALLRARADLDNERKRSTREIEKAHKFAVSQLLMALLPVKDSLELGLASTENTAEPASLRDGMQLTLEKLAAVFNEFGVEAIDPQGQPFNPEYHEAMNVEATDDVPPDTVFRVHQKGYLLNGRVMRPARVTVARAPEAI